MGSFKGQSIEDMLRQQIEKQEFYDGGSEKNPPSGGGGGGGGGGGSGESEDEGLVGIIDETMQVILATIGFIFLVIISFFSSALVHMVAQGIVFFQLNVSICKFLSIFISYGIESCHKRLLK
jgi:hypothetical protein